MPRVSDLRNGGQRGGLHEDGEAKLDKVRVEDHQVLMVPASGSGGW